MCIPEFVFAYAKKSPRQCRPKVHYMAMSCSRRGPLRHVCDHTNHRTTMIHTFLESPSNLDVHPGKPSAIFGQNLRNWRHRSRHPKQQNLLFVADLYTCKPRFIYNVNTTFSLRISTVHFKLCCNVDNVCMTISREWLRWFQFPKVGFLSIFSKFKISALFFVTVWCKVLGVVAMDGQTRSAFNRNQTKSLQTYRQCLCLRVTSI